MLLLTFLGEHPVGQVGWCAVECFYWSEPYGPDAVMFGVDFKRELSLQGSAFISDKPTEIKRVKLTRNSDGVHADFSLCENTRIHDGPRGCNSMGSIIVDYDGLVYGAAS